MAYHKKRIQPAPNKNNEKVRRREVSERSQATLKDLHPHASSLSLRLDYYDARGNLLDQRPKSYGPNDPIELQVDCLGPCGNGKIDLEGKIRDMIGKNETVFEGSVRCSQKLYADSSDVCGYELRCRIEINYRNN